MFLSFYAHRRNICRVFKQLHLTPPLHFPPVLVHPEASTFFIRVCFENRCLLEQAANLLLYLGAVLPTHAKVGALICGSSLPGPSCSCLLDIFVLLSNSPQELEELDQINSVFDKHIHGPAEKETSVTLLTVSVS